MRLGASLPKQFLEIGGRSLLERSIERFATHPGVAEVVVALPAAFVQPVSARMSQLGWSQVRCVEGGNRRQDSVANAAKRRSIVFIGCANELSDMPAVVAQAGRSWEYDLSRTSTTKVVLPGGDFTSVVSSSKTLRAG